MNIYNFLESILLEFCTELTFQSSEQKILENVSSTKSSKTNEISRFEIFNDQVSFQIFNRFLELRSNICHLLFDNCPFSFLQEKEREERIEESIKGAKL